MSDGFTNENYYEILGVSKTATFDEIKKQYRILVMKFHPDKEKSSLAESIMKKINEAYEILSNPEKRRLYEENSPNENSQNEKQNFESNKSSDKTNETTTKSARLKKMFEIWKIQAKNIGIELVKILLAMAQSAAEQNQSYSSRPKSHKKIRRQRYERIYEPDSDEDFEEDAPRVKSSRKTRQRKRRQRKRDDSESFDYQDYFGLDNSDFGFNIDEVFRS